jgi:hypothetical protein
MKTSDFESVSASLCLMSRAIEKKTSSTFMLVFALCISIISALKTAQWFWNDFPTRVLSAAYSFEKLDTVFICQSLTLWSWNSLRRIICSIKCSILIIGDMCTCITKRIDKEWVCGQTLLLSSMSALFPTNILLTLSEACCSMLRIQFLMSGHEMKQI